jgi:hypothetical protein
MGSIDFKTQDFRRPFTILPYLSLAEFRGRPEEAAVAESAEMSLVSSIWPPHRHETADALCEDAHHFLHSLRSLATFALCFGCFFALFSALFSFKMFLPSRLSALK